MKRLALVFLLCQGVSGLRTANENEGMEMMGSAAESYALESLTKLVEETPPYSSILQGTRQSLQDWSAKLEQARDLAADRIFHRHPFMLQEEEKQAISKATETLNEKLDNTNLTTINIIMDSARDTAPHIALLESARTSGSAEQMSSLLRDWSSRLERTLDGRLQRIPDPWIGTDLRGRIILEHGLGFFMELRFQLLHFHLNVDHTPASAILGSKLLHTFRMGTLFCVGDGKNKLYFNIYRAATNNDSRGVGFFHTKSRSLFGGNNPDCKLSPDWLLKFGFEVYAGVIPVGFGTDILRKFPKGNVLKFQPLWTAPLSVEHQTPLDSSSLSSSGGLKFSVSWMYLSLLKYAPPSAKTNAETEANKLDKFLEKKRQVFAYKLELGIDGSFAIKGSYGGARPGYYHIAYDVREPTGAGFECHAEYFEPRVKTTTAAKPESAQAALPCFDNCKNGKR